ncbi:MAG: hypothetical protein NVS3B16_19630 [Vulcanimicrobiaceae bacterium]
MLPQIPGVPDDGFDPTAHWRDFANTLPCIVYSLDSGGAVEFINDRWLESTGNSPTSVLGDAWTSVVHPDDLSRSSRRLRAALACGEGYEDEARLRLRDGTYRAMRSSARPVRDEFGRIARWLGTLVDVEDRKRSIASQAEAESRLETFLKTIPQIVWTADASGWIDWYNARWFDFTGQTEAEAAGWGWQAAHHPDDFLRVMEAWPKSIETGEPFEMEFRLRRHDGVFHWFLTRIMPLKDERGRVLRWYGTNTDIEEQKTALVRTAQIARKLQEAFLPERMPERSNLRFDAVYMPAESETLVGGDWYDAIDLPDGRIVISCGDVSGHGVSASVSVGGLRQAIVFAALDSADPGEILKRVNRVLRFQQATVATCVVAVLDPRDLSFAYALAGHPPPVVARASHRPELLPYTDAPPLGVVDDFAVTTRALQLDADAVVAFYSDGVTEFDRDIAGAERRLLAATAALVGDVRDPHPAAAIRRAVMGGAASTDDVALLILQCSPVVATSAVRETPAPLVKKWRFHSSDARTACGSRKELMAFLEPLADSSDDLYMAELVLGEMLANTVEHAPGLVEITIDWTGEFPRLTAVDNGPGMIVPAHVGTPADLSEDGRGLFIIKTFAREFTIDSTPGAGTRLTAALPLRKVGGGT